MALTVRPTLEPTLVDPALRRGIRPASSPADDYLVEDEAEPARVGAGVRIMQVLQILLILVLAVLSFAIFWVVGLLFNLF